MCRNIKTLFNFEPPATDDEVRAAALQFVRKISGVSKVSPVLIKIASSIPSICQRYGLEYAITRFNNAQVTLGFCSEALK